MSRELDAMVLRTVFGREPATPPRDDEPASDYIERAWGSLPPYSTDPAADYSVLVKVRETWDAEQKMRFAEAFARRLRIRCGVEFDTTQTVYMVLFGFNDAGGYAVGDWSAAALAALGIDTNTEGGPR